MRFNNCTKAFLIIFLISVVIRSILTYTIISRNNNDPKILLQEDSSTYLKAGSIYAGLSNTSFPIKEQTPDWLHNDDENIKRWSAPGYPSVLSIIFRVFGQNILNAIIFNIILFSLACSVLFLIGNSLLGSRYGFIMALIYMFYPTNLLYSISPLSEPLFILVFLLGIYCYTLYRDTNKNILLYLSSTLIVLSSFIKEISLLFIAILLLALVTLCLQKKISSISILKPLSIVAIISLLIFTGASLVNKSKYGELSWSKRMHKTAKFYRRIITTGSSHRGSLIKHIRDKHNIILGTGTTGLMRTSGYNVTDIQKTTANKNLSAYLKAISKKNVFFLYYQILGWIFLSTIYILSIIGSVRLYKNKKIDLLLLSSAGILYFILLSFNHTRYMMVPFIFFAMLSCFGIEYINEKLK